MNNVRVIRGLLINVVDGTCELFNCFDTVEAYRTIIDCDVFDITRRCINGIWYHIICDDEGAIKRDCLPVAYRSPNDIRIYGNIFICSGVNIDGNLQSLTDEEYHHLIGCLGLYYLQDHSNLPDHSVVMICGLDLE